MDVNDLRVAVTLIGLVLFIALVVHTWSRRRKSEHDAAAHLPFLDEEGQANTQNRQDRGEKSE